MAGIKKTTEEFVEAARRVHGDKYLYDKTNYVGYYTKLTITCKIHGDFLQRRDKHLHGYGCNECSISQKTFTREKFISRARGVHGERYRYDDVVFKNMRTHVTIRCLKHGNFSQTPDSHTGGHGCPKCALDVNRSNKDEFVARAQKVHGDRYKYDKVKYINMYTAVKITCTDHGDFDQIPSVHIVQKSGCPRCVGFISKAETCYLNLIGIPDENRQVRIGRYICDGVDTRTTPPTIYDFDGDYWHGNPDIYDQEREHPLLKPKTFGDLYQRTLKRRAALEAAGYKVVAIWESELPAFIKEWKREHQLSDDQSSDGGD